MNKRGDKTYSSKHYYEALAIGSKEDRDWLRKDKLESPKKLRKNMIRRWRRCLKQELSNNLMGS